MTLPLTVTQPWDLKLPLDQASKKKLISLITKIKERLKNLQNRNLARRTRNELKNKIRLKESKSIGTENSSAFNKLKNGY